MLKLYTSINKNVIHLHNLYGENEQMLLATFLKFVKELL